MPAAPVRLVPPEHRIMPCRRQVWRFAFGLAVSIAIANGAAAGEAKAKAKQPLIPSFERFYTDAKSDAAEGGHLLLGELNCISCHQPAGGAALKRQAPILDDIGGRARPGFLRKFLSDPHAAKPGTAMPDVLAGLADNEKKQRVEELVHFLASTGTLNHERPQRKLMHAGRDLYHKVGCVACHGTRDEAGNADKLFATSVPLSDLPTKYTIGSLTTFLENPHQTRPAGRMPGLLNGKEAKEIANYLMQGVGFEPLVPNMKYAYYEGSWSLLPDFDKLKPLTTGRVNGFDLSVVRRPNNFAVKFDGFLRIDREGTYRFYLTSDDGSKLFIDNKLVVENDGEHAPLTKSGTARLTKGMHSFTAGVFNVGGPYELSVQIEGEGLLRQSVAPHVFLTPEGPPKIEKPKKLDDDTLTVDPVLAQRGRTTFAAVGCANCHNMNSGKVIESTLHPLPLAKLRTAGGC